MLQKVSFGNISPQTYSTALPVPSKMAFGQSNDEFVTSKKQEEKTFLQKHWGKILGAIVLIAGGVLVKKHYFDDKTAKKLASEAPKTIVNEETPEKILEKKIKGLHSEATKLQETNSLKALEIHNECVQLDPDNYSVYFARGEFYNGVLKDTDNAISDYTKAIELLEKKSDKKGLSFAYDVRGMLYENKKQEVLAIADFTKAIEANPKNDKAYLHRHQMYLGQNKQNEALEDVSKAIENNPYSGEYYTARANLHKELGNDEKAQEDVAKALKLTMRT